MEAQQRIFHYVLFLKFSHRYILLFLLVVSESFFCYFNPSVSQFFFVSQWNSSKAMSGLILGFNLLTTIGNSKVHLLLWLNKITAHTAQCLKCSQKKVWLYPLRSYDSLSGIKTATFLELYKSLNWLPCLKRKILNRILCPTNCTWI